MPILHKQNGYIYLMLDRYTLEIFTDQIRATQRLIQVLRILYPAI